MLRPTSMPRALDDDQRPVIEAPASHINRDQLDCGITALQCCNTPGCQRLGTTRNFVLVLGLVGLVQAAVERYFRISVRQAAAQFDYDPLVVGESGGCVCVFVCGYVTHWIFQLNGERERDCVVNRSVARCFVLCCYHLRETGAAVWRCQIQHKFTCLVVMFIICS